MKPSHIQLIQEYNQWANNRVLAATARLTNDQFIAPNTYPYGGVRGSLVHILEAEFAWRTRLQNVFETFEDLLEPQFPTIEVLKARWDEESQAMHDYVATVTEDELLGVARYPASPNTFRERVRWHCLIHTFNHGTQHRSEVAAMLTDFGQSPGDLDFTIFLNEKAGNA